MNKYMQEVITKAVEQGIKAGYQAAKKEVKHSFNAYRAQKRGYMPCRC